MQQHDGEQQSLKSSLQRRYRGSESVNDESATGLRYRSLGYEDEGISMADEDETEDYDQSRGDVDDDDEDGYGEYGEYDESQPQALREDQDGVYGGEYDGLQSGVDEYSREYASREEGSGSEEGSREGDSAAMEGSRGGSEDDYGEGEYGEYGESDGEGGARLHSLDDGQRHDDGYSRQHPADKQDKRVDNTALGVSMDEMGVDGSQHDEVIVGL